MLYVYVYMYTHYMLWCLSLLVAFKTILLLVFTVLLLFHYLDKIQYKFNIGHSLVNIIGQKYGCRVKKQYSLILDRKAVCEAQTVCVACVLIAGLRMSKSWSLSATASLSFINLYL